MYEDLSGGFPLFTMLKHWNGGLNWRRLEASEQAPFTIPCAQSVKLTAIPLLSNAPPYSWMKKADVLLVDDTVWHNDEMIRQEVATKTGQTMGHLAQSGPVGMIEVLDTMPATRKILIHINNTNPIPNEDSPERSELTRQGIEVSWYGMHIDLSGQP